jgi:GH35 family endo-1,4-beta-xylanase
LASRRQCFSHRLGVIAQLRFLDFKSVEAYNTAIHRIVAQLCFCDQVVTELEMIEKTLDTFQPTNMVLQQQQYRNKYRKYCDLINVLLAAEAQYKSLTVP